MSAGTIGARLLGQLGRARAAAQAGQTAGIVAASTESAGSRLGAAFAGGGKQGVPGKPLSDLFGQAAAEQATILKDTAPPPPLGNSEWWMGKSQPAAEALPKADYPKYFQTFFQEQRQSERGEDSVSLPPYRELPGGMGEGLKATIDLSGVGLDIPKDPDVKSRLWDNLSEMGKMMGDAARVMPEGMGDVADKLGGLTGDINKLTLALSSGDVGGTFESVKSLLGNLSGLAGATGASGSPLGEGLAYLTEGPGYFKRKVDEKMADIKRRVGLMMEAGGEVFESFKSEQAQDIASRGFGSVEKAGQAIQGPELGPVLQKVGGAVETVGKFGKLLSDSLGTLRDWTNELVNSNFRFAEFSASMASVKAEMDVWSIEMSQRRGERRAGHAREVSEARMRLEAQVTPWEDVWAKIKDKVIAWGWDKLGSGMEQLNNLELIKEFLRRMLGGEGPGMTPEEAVRQVANREDWGPLHRRPQRFGRP